MDDLDEYKCKNFASIFTHRLLSVNIFDIINTLTWCSGSTRASKPLGLGSIPSGSANYNDLVTTRYKLDNRANQVYYIYISPLYGIEQTSWL